jgi:splicing factor 3B subunit 2
MNTNPISIYIPFSIFFNQYVYPCVGYPKLKIPGLNAPLPPGAQWGFHAGGWGKAPTDEHGNLLFQDTFTGSIYAWENPVDKHERFGEFVEEEELMDETEPAPPAPPLPTGPAPPAGPPPTPAAAAAAGSGAAGAAVDGGLSVIPGAGMETPSAGIELRKDATAKGDAAVRALHAAQAAQAALLAASSAQEPGQLYTVLGVNAPPQGAAGGIMGALPTYQIPGKGKGKGGLAQVNTQRVDVSLDPEMLEGADQATLKAEFDKALQKPAPLGPSAAEIEAEKKRKTKEAEEKNKTKKFKF